MAVLITVCKRSLGLDNIFASVYHSVHWGKGGGGEGWLPSMHHRSHDLGVCIWGDCLTASRGGGSTSRGWRSASRGGGLHREEGVGIQGRGSASKGRGSASKGVWSASRRSASREGLHPGDLSRLPPPPHSWDTVNKRTIRILLECILVIQY